MGKRKIIIIRGYLAAGKSTTFENLKAHKKMKDWLFLDFQAIRKMFNNNKDTQIKFADKTFYASLKELIKTGKSILTQETSKELLMNKMGSEIRKNKYEIITIALMISPDTSYQRASVRSKMKGKKPRTKKEVFESYKERQLKLNKEKIFIDAEKFTKKQVVNKMMEIIEG